MISRNLLIHKVLEPPVELTFENNEVTLKNTLESLANLSSSIEFPKKDGSVGHDVDEMLINGKKYLTWKQGLKTSLKDGDKVRVEIFLEVLCG